jgi:hypothetical protein
LQASPTYLFRRPKGIHASLIHAAFESVVEERRTWRHAFLDGMISQLDNHSGAWISSSFFSFLNLVMTSKICWFWCGGMVWWCNPYRVLFNSGWSLLLKKKEKLNSFKCACHSANFYNFFFNLGQLPFS